MRVEWVPEALRDLAEIIAGLYELGIDPDIIRDTGDKIFQKAERYNNHVMGAKREPDFAPLDVRSGYAIKTSYKMLFEVLGPEHIKVIMVRHSKRKPLSPRTIKKRIK